MAGLAEILEENSRLRAHLGAMEAALAAAQGALAETRDTLALREAELAAVQRAADDLAKSLELERTRHQRPASQRFVPEGQVDLPFDPTFAPPPRAPVATDDREDEQEDAEDDAPTARAESKKKPRRRTRADVDHLPGQTVHCRATSGACARCGAALQVIGQAVSFRVEWVPGHFVRHDVIRDKCACPRCPDQGVLTVPSPYALDRSLAGNGLVARAIVDKIADHIPANRQAKRMAREGFAVGSHTLSGWICAAGDLLRFVARAVQRELLTAEALQGDDTGMPVQDAGDGQLRKGRMWAFTDQEQVFYAFTDSKHGKFPNELLGQFSGRLLLVDGGSEFNEVVRTRGLRRAGCWSHLRTYFFKALQHHPHEARPALGTLRDLFLIERELWGRPADEVLAVRRARSVPLVDGFYAWVGALSQVTRPTSVLGEALGYALRQREAMRVFLDHGEVPMHNNLAELMLRQPVVGRKNWLFARSEGGAKAAAVLYTLVGSCYLQGVDPWHYLTDVLGRLQDYPANRVGELTPRQGRLARIHHAASGG